MSLFKWVATAFVALLFLSSQASASYKVIKRDRLKAFYNDRGELFKIEIDTNGDGKTDLVKLVKNGKVYEVKRDSDHNGSFDSTIYFKHGRVVRIEKDTNNDGRPDVFLYFRHGKLIEKKEDRNHDRKIDYVLDKKNNGIAIEKIDTNHDERFDIVNYYRHRRLFKCFKDGKEIVYNSKGLPVSVSDGSAKYIYKNGKLEKAILNGMVVLYRDDKKSEEKIDSNNDGKFDTFVFFKKGKILKIEKDRNFDGKVDLVELNPGKDKTIEIDRNFDGFFEAKLLFEGGKLEKKEFFKEGCKLPVRIERDDEILFDSNCDGKFEKVEKIEPNRIEVLVDKNEDGKFEGEFVYTKDHRLVEVMKDENHDGRFDTFITYKGRNCFVVKKDIDANGKVDMWKEYKDGKLVSVKKDLNGDGNPDITY